MQQLLSKSAKLTAVPVQLSDPERFNPRRWAASASLTYQESPLSTFPPARSPRFWQQRGQYPGTELTEAELLFGRGSRQWVFTGKQNVNAAG